MVKPTNIHTAYTHVPRPTHTHTRAHPNQSGKVKHSKFQSFWLVYMKRTNTSTSAMTFRIGNMPETSSNAERNLVKFHKVSVGGEECVFPFSMAMPIVRKTICTVYMRHAIHCSLRTVPFRTFRTLKIRGILLLHIMCAVRIAHVVDVDVDR